MKLVGIGTVKNEADIIESFVRHNLGRLDALVLIDDGSVDGTREILLSLEAEGLNLVTLEWDGAAGQEQSMKLSEMLLVVASRMDFDWIFALDADEAIDCESRAALEKALGKVAPGVIGTLPWRTYIPTATDDWAEANPFRRIVNRKAQESPQFYKVAIPKSLVKSLPIVITSGNHTAHKTTSSELMPMTALADVSLAHFPVRTPEQLVNKAICGNLSMLAEGYKRPNRNFHWRDMYAQFMRNGAPTIDEVERLARCYSGQRDDGRSKRSPLCIADRNPLRFIKNADLPNFVTITRTAERIIGYGRGSAKASNEVDLFLHRASWRNRATLFGSSQFYQCTAVADYLNRRFGENWLFIDGGSTPKTLCDYESAAANLVRAIVIVGQQADRERLTSNDWLKNGWAVDCATTLAVRLLATSARVRRYAFVLVPCDKDDAVRAPIDSLPAPSAPGWRENFGLAVLRCYFLALRFYWFFQATVSRARRTVLLDRRRPDRRAVDVRIAGAGWGAKESRK